MVGAMRTSAQPRSSIVNTEVVARMTSITTAMRPRRSPASSGRKATWRSTCARISYSLEFPIVQGRRQHIGHATPKLLRDGLWRSLGVRGILGGHLDETQLATQHRPEALQAHRTHIVGRRVGVEKSVQS